MPISRSTAFKLRSFAGVTVLAGAAHYFGFGEQTVGWLGTALALLGSGAHAWVGHLGVHLVESIEKSADPEKRARATQNQDLHRLMGETIARILEREAPHAPGGEAGAKSAAAKFSAWPKVAGKLRTRDSMMPRTAVTWRTSATTSPTASLWSG